MKKIVSVVMAAVMVCMSAAGCSGQKPAETGSSQTAAGSESVSPEGMAGAWNIRKNRPIFGVPMNLLMILCLWSMKALKIVVKC